MSKEKILVTGAAGQIGSELVPVLRTRHGSENVIAAGHNTQLPEDIKNTGPSISVDVLDYKQLDKAIKEHGVSIIYHLSSILSALGEQKPQLAFMVNVNGLYNVVEAARENGLKRVIIPSSIAAFGPETPQDNTPNDTIQKPRTMYGVSKVFGERLGDYYFYKFGLDVRGVRFPGIISWKTEPTAGTTDYAVAIFYEAIRKRQYESYLNSNARLPMMYMPDAVKALMDLADANVDKLKHHTDFNVNSMSFTPQELAETIKKRLPDFAISYKIDPVRQVIADSWPSSLDDSAARREWGWKPDWDLETMVDDMLANLEKKLAARR